jgi:hypothetical protein
MKPRRRVASKQGERPIRTLDPDGQTPYGRADDLTIRSSHVASTSPAGPETPVRSLIPPALVDFLPLFASLIKEIHAVPSVKRAAFSIGERQIDFWVVMLKEDLADTERILDLTDSHLQGPDAPPIDLHVVPLDRVDEANLPPAVTVFDR